MKLLLLIWVALFSSHLFADEAILTEVTNGLDSSVHALVVTLDDEDNITKFTKAVYKGEDLVTVFDFSPEESRKGIVLEHRFGKDFVTVQLAETKSSQKVLVYVSMLKNYLSGSMRTITLDLVYKDGDWKLQKEGRTIINLHFKKRFLGVKIKYTYE